MDLDAVADELYGLTPGEFVPARQARATGAQQAGDRKLAAAIKKLRRPTTGAWLGNLLGRQRPEELLQLLELGEAARRAHSTVDADDLRRLSRQRRQLVAALSHDARRLAGDIGHPVSDAVGRELEDTLEAAFADPDACEAVRSGRLTTALSYSGLGPMDATGAAEPGPVRCEPEAPLAPKRTKGSKGSKGPGGSAKQGDDEVDRQRRKRSEATAVEAVGEAQAAVAGAERELEDQQRRLAESRDRLELRRREVTALERELQDLRDVQDRAAAEVDHAEEAQSGCESNLRAAGDRLALARADLDRLQGPTGNRGEGDHPSG